MTRLEAHDEIIFRGDSVMPPDGGHDLRVMVAECVSRLPGDVQEWLLEDTTHVFIGGHGQHGEFIDLFFNPNQMENGLHKLRIIYLSEALCREPESDVLWTIAHEIAHSRLNHDTGGFDVEVEADALAKEWGFQEPEGRACDRQKYK